MMSTCVPAFYFPTSVAIVDDSADFLANLSLQLPTNLAFKTMTSPFDALIDINGRQTAHAVVDHAFSVYDQRDELAANRHVISIRLDAITSIVTNPNRFATVSVVVVDYDMAEMDGLEFCRNLRNPSIRKILLTGKADEQIVINAFNDGLIDRFIRKQAQDALPTLIRSIGQLQLNYFEIAERTLSDALALGPQRFLSDPAFRTEFVKIRERLGIVEHYLVYEPEGLLLVNATGKRWRLVVMDSEACEGYAEIAQELGAPDTLVRAIASGQRLPCQSLVGSNPPRDATTWNAITYPATAIPDSRLSLRYALAQDAVDLVPDELFSYSRYLDESDTAIA